MAEEVKVTNRGGKRVGGESGRRRSALEEGCDCYRGCVAGTMSLDGTEGAAFGRIRRGGLRARVKRNSWKQYCSFDLGAKKGGGNCLGLKVRVSKGGESWRRGKK